MNRILGEVRPGTPLVLFSDYDGTLVPCRKTPAEAVLRPARRRLLEALAKRIRLVMISGRSAADLRSLVDIDGIAYVGDHGLEISTPGGHWVHPAAKKAGPALAAALERIGRRLGGFPGAFVEKKGYSGSVHYRLLDPRLRRGLKRLVERQVRMSAGALRLTEGKMVFELRPNVDWDKGKAARRLAARPTRGRKPVLIYIGDDRTDEDAFRELGPEAVTIFVGSRRRTRAHYRLRSVRAVWSFLHDLERWRPNSGDTNHNSPRHRERTTRGEN